MKAFYLKHPTGKNTPQQKYYRSPCFTCAHKEDDKHKCSAKCRARINYLNTLELTYNRDADFSHLTNYPIIEKSFRKC